MKFITLHIDDDLYEEFLFYTQNKHVEERAAASGGRTVPMTKREFFNTPEGKKALEEGIRITEQNRSEKAGNAHITAAYEKYRTEMERNRACYGRLRPYGGTKHQEDVESQLSQILDVCGRKFLNANQVQRARAERRLLQYREDDDEPRWVGGNKGQRSGRGNQG